MSDSERSKAASIEPLRAREPIALVGIGCRFPGGSDTPEAFWRFIESGRNAIVEVPEDRWDLTAFYDQDPGRPAKTYSKWGGFLDQVDEFDAAFFGISPREAESMDPQQRLLLEVAWEAMEDAGLTLSRLSGTDAGVFVGISTHDYSDIHAKDVYTGNSYTNSGGALSIAANRISYALDLRGPSMAVDTACSSSLVAVHLACQAIWGGECSVAIAGGVNCIITPEPTIGFSKANMLSPDGQCHTFDAAANGYVRGEGAGVVLLKPLAQAIADNDPIYAVIRGTGVNQDGHTHGLTVPSQEQQEALLRQVYGQAGIAAEDVLYVEAHGTGTPVGDPIEANALGAVLGAPRSDGSVLLVGSVKTNIGHLEAASGMAGLIKAAMSIKHRGLAPNRNFSQPNPRINFDRLKLRVQQEAQAWPAGDGASVIGINSFGFGGTNAHVVLDTVPQMDVVPAAASDRGAYLVPISARSPEALRSLAEAYRDIADAPDSDTVTPIAGLAYTAGTRRSHLENRLALTVRSNDELSDQLNAFLTGEPRLGMASGRSPSRPPRLAFVFSGMGPQWQGMGRQLLDEEPVFRAAVEECDVLFQQHAGWSILKELLAEAQDSRMADTEVAQPANFVLQVGLTALWRSWGIAPDAIVGHSAGEVAAAYAAGVLSLPDAVRVIYHRSRLQQRATGKGGMLALGLSADDAMAALNGHHDLVSLAAINSQRAVTLSGEADAIRDIAEKLEAERVFARVMDVNVPYHSQYMDPLRDELMQTLAPISPREAGIPFYSTVYGGQIDGDEVDAGYWWRNVREPVRFWQALEAILDEGIYDFVEIAPHPVLSRSVIEVQNGRGAKGAVLASLRRDNDEPATMLSALGTLFTLSLPVDWQAVNPPAAIVELPLYPWQRERHWNEADVSTRFRFGKLAHPLLERRLDSAYPAWETHLNSHDLAYLGDHQIQRAVLYPAAAYVEMALAAARELDPTGQTVLSDVEFKRPLTLTAETPTLQLIAGPDDRAFSIYSLTDTKQWTLHSAGTIGSEKPGLAASKPGLVRGFQRRSHREFTGEFCYRALAERGLNYGPHFQGISRLWAADREALGQIVPSQEVQAQAETYNLHPAVLDACFQVLIGAAFLQAQDASGKSTYVPVKIDRLRLIKKPGAGAGVWAHARLTQQSDAVLAGDFTILSDEGDVLAEIEGFRCQALPSARKGAVETGDCLYELAWFPRALAAFASGRDAGDLASSRTVAASLQATLRATSDAESALESICGAYVYTALREHGWQPVKGRRFDLGVLADLPQPIAASVIDALSAAGYLAGSGESFVVQRAEAADLAALSSSFREAHPRDEALLTEIELAASRLSALLGGADDGETPAEPGAEAVASPVAATLYPLLGEAVRRAIAGLSPGRTIRVLQLGDGNRDLTAAVLATLPQDRTEYVVACTDAALPGLRQQSAAPFVSFISLDSLEAHGLPPHSFDIIVGAGVISAADDAAVSIAGLRGLLASRGLLIALEPTRSPSAVNFARTVIAGVAPLNARPAEAWQEALTAAGLLDAVAVGAGEAESAYTLLIAHGEATEDPEGLLPPSRPGRWLVFADNSGLGAEVAEQMGRGAGAPPVVVRIGAEFKRLDDTTFEARSGHPEDIDAVLEAVNAARTPLTGVAYLWSLETPTVSAAAAEGLPATALTASIDVLHLVQGLARLGTNTPPRLWLVTRGAQSIRGETISGALQAPLWGLGRVIMNEFPHLKCSLIDLDPAGNNGLHSLVEELTADDAEQEVCLRSDARYLSRVVALKQPATESSTAQTGRKGPFTLELTAPGSLDGFALVEQRRRKPAADEVEIEVHAAGVNFRDIMKAMGLYPQEDGAPFWLGDECAGVIARVGRNVTDFKPGDAVLTVAPGCFRSYVNVPAATVVRKPEHVSFEEAASIPIVFLTTQYALNHVGALSRGERILIHAAAGGVGLAAVQLARLAGAEIFGTAGNPDKRRYLQDLGVHHVMDSRSLDFAAETMRLTAGKGIDVVLNSLAGEFIPKSMSLLQPMGRFLELGKVDLYQNSKLGLWPFRSGLSFSAIDMGWLIQNRPELSRTLLTEVMQMFEDRRLTPLPVEVFPASEATKAFRFMAQARHIGKIVLSLKEAAAPVIRKTLPVKPLFRKDATYLITGGLGGFGLATAEWMAKQGAKNLVLVGRSGASTPEAQQAVARLRSSGVRVEVEKADAGNRQQVVYLIARVGATMPPLRGIFHAAMGIDDGYLLQLNQDRFETVYGPKVEGAWNLHLATRGLALDYFVLFSSIASLVGSVGQGNYSAANAFLDSLAQQRRAAGLPALSVNWGVIADVGYAARNQEVSRLLERQGLIGLKPEEATEMLGVLLRRDVAEAAAIRLDIDKWGEALGRGAAYQRFSHLLQSRAGGAATGRANDKRANTMANLASSSPEEQLKQIEELLRREMANVLGIAPGKIDPDQELIGLGLDSLMSVELEMTLERELGTELPLGFFLVEDLTLRSLSVRLRDLLENAGVEDPEPIDGGVDETESTPGLVAAG